MKVINLSNFFNHHQKFVSDYLYSKLGEGYRFVETSGIPEEQRVLGYHSYREPYLLQYNKQTKGDIDKLIIDADIVQFGQAPLSLIKERIRMGKVVVRDSERRFKSIDRYLKWPIYTFQSFYFNKGYLLASSAFAPWDYFLSGMKPAKCYKWGYFPEETKYDDVGSLFEQKKEMNDSRGVDVSLLWAGRLIRWKHPDVVILVANMLKKLGISYEINIIGSGPLEISLRQLIVSNGLDDDVHLIGPLPPEKVRMHMEKSDIFLMTSDQNEGWGATLNESMNSACAVVAGHMIGSVPFLLKNGENGLVYKNRDWKEMCGKVAFLALHPDFRKMLGKEAYRTITEVWNPGVAGNNLLLFYHAVLTGRDIPIKEGPCSRAEILTHRWLKKER